MKARVMKGLLVLALLLVAGTASAQSPPRGTISADQSIAQAVVVSPPPPANFNPLSASVAELEANGYPPRPDPIKAPSDYARWQRLVSVPRIANPKVQQTKIYNGAAQILSSRTLRNGTVAAQLANWSGYAVTVPTDTFTANNSFVVGEWVVPTAQQALGVCNGFTDFSSQWVGFDGVTSNDVLQAGTDADACCGNCNGLTQQQFYSSWFEWFPFPQILVSPAVRAGDLMATEVWYTIDGVGHALLVNYTLWQAAQYNFFPPPGTVFAGDSAEWIMERPAIEGVGLADLTHYTADQFNNDFASNSSSYFSPSSSPAGSTIYAITMVCPPWTPSESCPTTNVLSTPFLYPPSALWFYDSPPAQ